MTNVMSGKPCFLPPSTNTFPSVANASAGQLTPGSLCAIRSELRRKALKESRELHLPRDKTAMGQSTFEYAAAKEWNEFPKELCACETLRIFKIKTLKFLTESDKAQHKCNV